jgi:putative N6-adenine-specific DNA methylase
MEFQRLYGRRADKVRKLYNGMMECNLYQFFRPDTGRPQPTDRRGSGRPNGGDKRNGPYPPKKPYEKKTLKKD